MDTPGGRPRDLVLAATALLVLAGLLVGGPLVTGAQLGSSEPQTTPDYLHTVSTDPESPHDLWPYTSRAQSYRTATLPINVVVNADADYVRFVLVASAGSDWEPPEEMLGNETENGSDAGGENGPATDGVDGPITDGENGNVTGTEDANATGPESGVRLNGTSIEWTPADGATRYTYVHDRTTGEGRWVTEAYQLHDGTYLGSRYHLRLYRGSAGEHAWTAVQAHSEHWDWFRLRHTVSSVEEGQRYLEGEFVQKWFVEGIRQRNYGNGGAHDSDDWVTIVDVSHRYTPPTETAPARHPDGSTPLLFGVGAASALGIGATGAADRVRRRFERHSAHVERGRYLLLFASLACIILFQRLGSIAVEEAFPGLSPKLIAAAFYPLLVVVIPAAAVLLARGLIPGWSALAAGAGFGTGVLADYAYLGVTVLPIDVIIHRTVLLVAVSLLAVAGSTSDEDESRWNVALVVGLVVWAFALLLPLFHGY